MNIRIMAAAILLLILFPALTVSADPPPYSQLELRAYDPAVDPDIDMFISSWEESAPQNIYGGLIERVIFTRCEGGDPMRPKTRGAVLEYADRLSYVKLHAGKSTSPTVLKDEQIILYTEGGNGVIEAGGRTASLKSGIGVFVPEGLEFVIRSGAEAPLTMYLISEPVPEGFTPVTDIIVKDENTMPIGTTKSHWSHILRVFYYGEEAARALTTVTGMCPVWFDPMTLGQPHSHDTGVEEIWFLVEGEIVLMLGKELRRLTPGMAYKIPPNGTTPHSNINVSDSDAKLIWFMARTKQ